MKREFLRGLGIEDNDIIDQIMKANGDDINAAKSSKDSEIEALRTEKEAGLKSLNELQGKYNAQLESTKDYAELKEFKASTLAKQEQGRKEEWLKGQGCKYPNLLVNQIDFTKATYDEEKKTYTGIDDQVESLRGSYGEMFSQTGTQQVQPTPQQPNPNQGGFKEAYLNAHPEMAKYMH